MILFAGTSVRSSKACYKLYQISIMIQKGIINYAVTSRKLQTNSTEKSDTREGKYNLRE